MITILIAMILLITLIIFTEKNPIKIRFILIIISLINFSAITLSSSKRWLSLILLLIFLGGIIIIFIILSSSLPNEKTKKIKSKWIFRTILIVIIIGLRNRVLSNTINIETTKWFINRRHTTIAITIIMTLYFWIFNRLTRQQQTSIRTLLC